MRYYNKILEHHDNGDNQMELFDYMDNIFFEDYDHFIEQVDSRRKEFLFADTHLLQDNHIILDLDKTVHIPNGRVNIPYKDIMFECVFHYKASKKLYVLLNGALTLSPPQFTRWSYYPFLDGCMLNIADPMYRRYSDLKLGWYYGSEQYDLRAYVAELVKKVAHILEIEDKNIVFWGSSGGGAAAIECASLIEGAKTVAINPQIMLSEYDYEKDFRRITGSDLRKRDAFHRNDAIYYLKYTKESNFLLIFNIRSKDDMIQVKNICLEFDISVKYGLNVFPHLIIWLYDAECEPFVSGHSAQEYYCIGFVIMFLLNNIMNPNMEKEYAPLVRLINEFWQFYWQQEKRLRAKKIDFEILVMCRESNKKVVLWGGGVLAREFSSELFDIKNNNYYKIQLVIDNDKSKEGTYFDDKLLIQHPDSILDWKDYFIIIAVKRNRKDIQMQLESLNLQYHKDFIYCDDLYAK